MESVNPNRLLVVFERLSDVHITQALSRFGANQNADFLFYGQMNYKLNKYKKKSRDSFVSPFSSKDKMQKQNAVTLALR